MRIHHFLLLPYKLYEFSHLGAQLNKIRVFVEVLGWFLWLGARLKGKYRLRVAPKSFKRLKLKLKGLTRKTRPIAFADRVAQVNRLMKGWLQYFKYAHCHQKLKELDGWVRNRLRYCIWKHWKKPEKRRRSFIRMGVKKGQSLRLAPLAHGRLGDSL